VFLVNEYDYILKFISFNFSSLVSSTLIYNIKGNLNENHLKNLATFTEYGREASKEGYNQIKPFQSLIFLIRDWSSPDQHEYGRDGGKQLIKDYLLINDAISPESINVRRLISKCFENIEGFLLPRPGDAVMDGKAEKLSDFDDKFRYNITNFFDSLFDENVFKPKEIGNISVTVGQMYEYIKNYCVLFKDSRIPTPISVIEATTRSANTIAIDKSLDYFNKHIKSMDDNDWLIKYKTVKDTLKYF
jgi:atlastin